NFNLPKRDLVAVIVWRELLNCIPRKPENSGGEDGDQGPFQELTERWHRRTLHGPGASESPHDHRRFQLLAKMIGHSAADQFNETQSLADIRAFVDDYIVGVTLADFGAADARPLEPRLFDELIRGEPLRILEHAAGGLKTEGLMGLAMNPELLHALENAVR